MTVSEETDRSKLDLSFAQVGAAVLVTLTTTVGGSFLGTGGTIVSAVTMSVLSTVAGAIYKFGLTTVPARFKNGRVIPAHREWRMPKPSSRVIISTGVLGSIVVFGVLAVITSTEAVAGKPVSAIVKGEPGHGTTLGGGRSGSESPPPSPTSSLSPSTSVSPTPPAAPPPVPSVEPSAPPSVIPDDVPSPPSAPTELPSAPVAPTPEPSG